MFLLLCKCKRKTKINGDKFRILSPNCNKKIEKSCHSLKYNRRNMVSGLIHSTDAVFLRCRFVLLPSTVQAGMNEPSTLP